MHKIFVKILVTEDQLLKTPYLRWCIMEAIRLRSPGVVTRRVIKPFTVKVKYIKHL